jgi:signal transduction histidine kinase
MRCAGTELDEIVRFAIHGLHDVAIQRRIRIRWESSSQRAWVCCDEERVCFVLLDLMRNAVGLSRPGSEVIVSTWCSGSEVGVEIHDHSEGLSADERAMVAEPLWWPSWTSSDTALGLCIAWVVATAHGGRVSVETTAGVGTSLWFVLPRGLLH